MITNDCLMKSVFLICYVSSTLYQENTTALYVACQYSHHDVIESLLAAGADVNIARSNVSNKMLNCESYYKFWGGYGSVKEGKPVVCMWCMYVVRISYVYSTM